MLPLRTFETIMMLLCVHLSLGFGPLYGLQREPFLPRRELSLLRQTVEESPMPQFFPQVRSVC